MKEKDEKYLKSKLEEIEYLKEIVEDYEKKETVTLDSSNLMELQEAELLVKAQKKFSLQELEDMFGGNSFDL